MFLAAVAAEPVGGLSPTTLATAANKTAAGIDSQLTTTPASGQLGFIEGTNDALRPIDAQTLGILYLLGRGRYADALKVHNSIESAFKLTGRTIAKSSAPSTFNMTYSAGDTLSGYRPYATGGPDVLWNEGSAEADLATKRSGATTPPRTPARCKPTARSPTAPSTSTTCGRRRPGRAGPCWPSAASRHNAAAMPLEQLIERLELAATSLRAGELDAERAAALVEDCARLAAEASAELDREVRAADSGPAPAGQLALGS